MGLSYYLAIADFSWASSAVANATNRIAIVGQNIFAVAGFRSKGINAWPYNLYLGISALIGAISGARIAIQIPDLLFNRILSVIMVVVAVVIIIRPLKNLGSQTERMDLNTR